MFITAVLICGLPQGYLTPQGCRLITSNVPYSTEAECREAILTFKYEVQLPEGAYVAGQNCVTLGRPT